jgi:CheY-like chemotaxis protein
MARILIIEDDADIRTNTAELLELEGFVVCTASNGKKGLEEIEKLAPDLILCDLRMPEMDGFEVLAHLGKCPDHKRIPFIFFSAKSEKVDVRTGINAGADAYLIKPFELPDLLAAIQRCLLKGKIY